MNEGSEKKPPIPFKLAFQEVELILEGKKEKTLMVDVEGILDCLSVLPASDQANGLAAALRFEKAIRKKKQEELK